MSDEFFYGTGRRKSAVSRTRIYKGNGRILVNDRPFEEYFPRPTLVAIVRQALMLVKLDGRVDVKATVAGGGMTGQAEAVRHGISRALIALDPELRGVLKKAGLLTRDAREKERKKPGQRGARARFQYSKR